MKINNNSDFRRIPIMTKQEFQIIHSEIIEHFQIIEFNLKKMCSLFKCLIFKDNSFERYMALFSKIENDTIGYLIAELKKLQKEADVTIFSDSDYELLEKVRKSRNYWCHNCFEDIIFSVRGIVKNKNKEQKALNELKFARNSDYYIRGLFENLHHIVKLSSP